MKKEKIILTDCDGAICNWNSSFERFMIEHGYPPIQGTDHEYRIEKRHSIDSNKAWHFIREFNESEQIGRLEPFADSIEYISKLSDMGFRFVVITSLSDSEIAKQYRTHNLQNLFGDVFNDIVCLKTGVDKSAELMKWQDSGYLWIEDHVQNAIAGYNVGLSPILIRHSYNSYYNDSLFPIVNNDEPWKDIFKIACNKY